MKFNVDKFLFLYSNEYGEQRAPQINGIKFLLSEIEADEAVTDLRHVAYILATTRHETAATMQPIEEYGHGSGKKYGLPDAVTGKCYFGRGFVQLTWKENYEAMSRIFGLDFVHEPEMVMRPSVAYRIMSHGMRKGSFTGKRLDMYINDTKCDYYNARRIINGTNCADLIAGYAQAIEAMLKNSEVT